MPRGQISQEGRDKAAAKNIGIPLTEYYRWKNRGYLRCCLCKTWKKAGPPRGEGSGGEAEWLDKGWKVEVASEEMVRVPKRSGQRCKECSRKKSEEARKRGSARLGE